MNSIQENLLQSQIEELQNVVRSYIELNTKLTEKVEKLESSSNSKIEELDRSISKFMTSVTQNQLEMTKKASKEVHAKINKKIEKEIENFRNKVDVKYKNIEWDFMKKYDELDIKTLNFCETLEQMMNMVKEIKQKSIGNNKMHNFIFYKYWINLFLLIISKVKNFYQLIYNWIADQARKLDSISEEIDVMQTEDRKQQVKIETSINEIKNRIKSMGLQFKSFTREINEKVELVAMSKYTTQKARIVSEWYDKETLIHDDKENIKYSSNHSSERNSKRGSWLNTSNDIISPKQAQAVIMKLFGSINGRRKSKNKIG